MLPTNLRIHITLLSPSGLLDVFKIQLLKNLMFLMFPVLLMLLMNLMFLMFLTLLMNLMFH